jgi:hypothetical protein
MPKKFEKKSKADVHDELKGFEIKINEFGEMESTMSIDKLNAFLNEKLSSEKKTYPKRKKSS